MNTAINAMLTITGQILENGEVAESVLEGTITSVCGIQSLQMGVFGGIIVGLGVAALHNRFLPDPASECTFFLWRYSFCTDYFHDRLLCL